MDEHETIRIIMSNIQKVGRVIRKPIKEGEIDVNRKKKNFVTVYDFFDNTHRDLLRHSMNRFKTYSMEEAFVVKEVEYD